MLLTPESVRERRRRVLAVFKAQHIPNEEAGRQLLEIDPDYPPGWLALGSARLTAGEFETAEPLLRRAVAGAPSNPGFYLPLAALYRERGDESRASCLAALALWKVSFYERIPEGLADALAERMPTLRDSARDPEMYEVLAETAEAKLAEDAWPGDLLPYRLLNDVQRQAAGGLDPDLIQKIVANGDECAPLFRAALREAYDSEVSSLSFEAEALVTALLGEIGGVELVEDLLSLADEGYYGDFLHSQWAVRRLGQRFPAEAFSVLRKAAAGASVGVRAVIAQQYFFLPAIEGARDALLELLDGFAEFATDDEAPYLLLTVSTLFVTMGGGRADALAILKRHERQLSKEGRRWVGETLEGEPPFVPELVESGVDQQDVETVCIDLALLDEEEDEGDDDEFEDEFEDEFDEPEPVARPGRNEPCWCGSGKKYKKCHLQEDEQRDRESEEQSGADAFAADAWQRLFDASTRYHRRADVQEAYRLYFDREMAEIDPESLPGTGFIEWYLLDFRAPSGGRTVVEEFLRRRGARLTDQAQALIESWRSSRYGLWQSLRIHEDGRAEVKDVFAGDTCVVGGIPGLNEGVCVIERIHEFDGRWQFLGDGLVVRESALDGIRAHVETRAAEEGVTPAEYFRSRSHEWQRFVLETHGDA